MLGEEHHEKKWIQGSEARILSHGWLDQHRLLVKLGVCCKNTTPACLLLSCWATAQTTMSGGATATLCVTCVAYCMNIPGVNFQIKTSLCNEFRHDNIS